MLLRFLLALIFVVSCSKGKNKSSTNAPLVEPDEDVQYPEFITVWNTAIMDIDEASANNQIKLPLSEDGYNFTVNWGDGTTDTITSSDQEKVTHTYPEPGVYTVTILGTLPKMIFYEHPDRNKIVEVKNWGNNKWKDLEKMFYGCANLNMTAKDAPDMSELEIKVKRSPDFSDYDAKTLSEMFRNAKTFNGNINHWDVSTINDFSYMFKGAENFNQDLNNWDTSRAISMEYIFNGAKIFNKDIGSWDTSNVKTMVSMFY